MRLYLLLEQHHLVDFIDEFLSKVDLLEILGVLSEYLYKELYIFLIGELEGLLNDGRDCVVAKLIEHDLPEGIPLFVCEVTLVHKSIVD